MATIEPTDQLRFSPESFDFLSEVPTRLRRRMSELALQRVRAEHRQRVTEEDVKATLQQAFRDVLAEFGVSIG
ncbi:MAG: hypothetical protein ACREHD_13850 [Pirellulales bacterium]